MKYTTETFIEKAKIKHSNKYDYSKVHYIDSKTKVCIICPKHGEFSQRPNDHLVGKGCKKCYDERRGETQRSNKAAFIEKANNTHNDKYDYSKVDYVNTHKEVCIICPIHGEFLVKPASHLSGVQCKECAKIERAKNKTLTTEAFISKAKKVHGDKYDYSLTKYNGIYNTVEIVCPTHGVFKQVASYHLSGNGCQKCKRSKLEDEIEQFLIENNIEFIPQYRQTWLGQQSLDFYVPSKKIAIECQGEQHFKPINIFGGEGAFKHRQTLDKHKLHICKEHNIKILYFSNLGIEYPYQVFEDKNKLLQEIRNDKIYNRRMDKAF
jgi:very-short-patch-repair endonuclease